MLTIANGANMKTTHSVVLLCTLLVVGCGKSPEPDSNGELPSQVVIKAYEAARQGDYDKANSFGTDAYRQNEESMRASAIEQGTEQVPSASWIYLAHNLDGKVDHYEVVDEGFTKLGYAFVEIVPVLNDGSKGTKGQVLFKLVDGQWKLATLKELNEASGR